MGILGTEANESIISTGPRGVCPRCKKDLSKERIKKHLDLPLCPGMRGVAAGSHDGPRIETVWSQNPYYDRN